MAAKLPPASGRAVGATWACGAAARPAAYARTDRPAASRLSCIRAIRFGPIPLTPNGVTNCCNVPRGTVTPALAARSRREAADSLTLVF